MESNSVPDLADPWRACCPGFCRSHDAVRELGLGLLDACRAGLRGIDLLSGIGRSPSPGDAGFLDALLERFALIRRRLLTDAGENLEEVIALQYTRRRNGDV